MFIKKAVKAYAYLMLLNFKASVTYKIFFNFTPDSCVRCGAAFVSHITRFFARHCPMSGANIQTC